MNVDTLIHILNRIDAADVRSLAGTLGDQYELNDISYAIEQRLGPKYVFQGIFGDVDMLMYVMRRTKTILSGSHAADYFYPGSCDGESDFDFFTNSPASTEDFRKYLEYNGVKWNNVSNNYENESNENIGPIDDVNVYTGTKTHGKKVYKVQLIQRWSRTAFESILNFHSSAPQCIITGFCAISLYHYLSKNRQAIIWDLTNEFVSRISSTLYEGKLRGIQKYKDRGFTMVDANSTIETYSKKTGYNIRSLDDNKCRIISFENYIHADIENPPEYIHSDTPDLPISIYIQRCKKLTWYEYWGYMYKDIYRTYIYNEGECFPNLITDENGNPKRLFGVSSISRMMNRLAGMYNAGYTIGEL